MQPELLQKVKTAVSQHAHHPHIFQHNGQYYLTLHQIRSDNLRERTFHLLRKMQIGEDIDLAKLPVSIRRIIHPHSTPVRSLTSNLTMSIAIGMMLGLMAMAIGMLFVTIFGSTGMSNNGIQTTSIIFVVSCVISWLVTTAILQFRKKSNH